MLPSTSRSALSVNDHRWAPLAAVGLDGSCMAQLWPAVLGPTKAVGGGYHWLSVARRCLGIATRAAASAQPSADRWLVRGITDTRCYRVSPRAASAGEGFRAGRSRIGVMTVITALALPHWSLALSKPPLSLFAFGLTLCHSLSLFPATSSCLPFFIPPSNFIPHNQPTSASSHSCTILQPIFLPPILSFVSTLFFFFLPLSTVRSS